jgi:acyl-CoA thioesterase
MVHRHHSCHGAYLSTLADSAFAYACNRNSRNPVASACHIDFLSPARALALREVEDSEAGASSSAASQLANALEGNPQ